MLAGVGAVDACLFVVAATEGWKPQSEEHLRILQLLGIRHGVIALTKADLVDDEWREIAAMDDAATRVAGTFLDGAPVVATSLGDPATIDEVRRQLSRVLSGRGEPDGARPRLWVDRSFAVAGAGTVVTGSLVHGSFSVGDEVVIEPRGATARIRGIQRAGADVATIGPGQRCALNLSGVSRDGIGRGDAVVAPGTWWPTAVLDARLATMPSLDHDATSRGDWVLHVGTAEVRPRIRFRTPVAPGGSGRVRAWLPLALPLSPGDRFVLRETGRNETVGSGKILDVSPVLPASRATPDRSVARVVAERRGVLADELLRLTGEKTPPVLGPWVVDPAALETARTELRARIDDAGPLGLELARLDDRARLVLGTLDDITVDGGRVRPAAQQDPLAGHPFVAALEAAPFSPPDPLGVDRAELRELVRHGAVVDLGGVFYAASAVGAAARLCARLLADRPDGFTVAEFRDAAGSSRKHTLPLLARMDETGVTRRRGDYRIAGPRLPASG